MGTHSWLLSLFPGHQRRVRFQKFDYAFESTGEPYITQIDRRARDLAESLKRFCASEAKQVPVFVICHSIGGLLLKRTFSIFREEKHRYMNVIKVVSGLCFISTPHLGPDSPVSKTSILDLMLAANRKEPPSSRCVSMEDNVRIRETCQYFRDFCHRLPMISCCENTPTRVAVRGHMYRRHREVLLISEELSGDCIDSDLRSSKPIPVEKGHHESCLLASTDLAFESIRHFFGQLIIKAPALIDEALRSNPNSWTRTGTVRSHSIHLPTLLLPTGESLSAPGPILTPGTTNTISNDRSHVFPTPEGSVEMSSATMAEQPPVYAQRESLRDPCLPCFSVPWSRNLAFFGRDPTLQLIDSALCPDRGNSAASSVDQTVSALASWNLSGDESDASSLRSFSVVGMAGVGKTSIAIEYAHLSREKYDAILWIKADEKTRVPDEFAKLAEALGLIESASSCDLPQTVQTMKNWLSRPVRSYTAENIQEDVPWLLVFDNVDDFETLTDYWPTEGTGSILVTSRDPLAKNQVFTVRNGIDVAPFSVEQSKALYQKLVRQSLESEHPEAFEEVANRLGGLPLLITTMAGVIRRLHLGYKDFLEIYNEIGLADTEQLSRSASTEDQYDIFYRLGFTQLSSQALSMLQTLSFLDPDCVQESLLRQGLLQNKDDASSSFTTFEYFKAKAELLQASLISQDQTQKTVHLHRIVQEICRKRMRKEEEISYFDATISLVSKVWPFQSLERRFNTSRYGDCSKYFSHVFALRHGHEQLMKSASHQVRPNISAAALFNDAGWYYFERGFPMEAKPFFKLALWICQNCQQAGSQEASAMLRETYNNLGSASGEANDYAECLQYNSAWFNMTLDRKNENHETIMDYELAVAHNEMGVALAMNHRYDEAISMFVRSIELNLALPESQYEDTLLRWPMPNLGLMYWVRGSEQKNSSGLASAWPTLELARDVLQEIFGILEDAHGVDNTVSFL